MYNLLQLVFSKLQIENKKNASFQRRFFVTTDLYYFRNLIRKGFINKLQISVWKTSFGIV